MADPRYRRISALKPIRDISGRKTRIRIPQPVKRPLKTEGVVRRSLLREDPDWFILHRRGVRRPKVGMDPLETRAVSEASVRGYLNERVVYKWLTVNNFRPGADFDYQSSREGGRLELGGMVVDFLFPYMRIALNVQGPGHEGALRHRKDLEQAQMMMEMGFTPVEVTTETIASQPVFDNYMRRVFLDRTLVFDKNLTSFYYEDAGLDEDYPELEEYIADLGLLLG